MIKTTPEPDNTHSTSSDGSVENGNSLVNGRLEFKLHSESEELKRRPMVKMDSGYSSTERMMPNQLSVGKKFGSNSDRGSLEINNSSSYSSKDVSPFTDSESPRGSTGFVQLAGSAGGSAMTRKDTAYDSVRVSAGGGRK